MDSAESRMDSIIRRLEAGEPIDWERETALVGFEFARDSLKRHGKADDELFESFREQRERRRAVDGG